MVWSLYETAGEEGKAKDGKEWEKAGESEKAKEERKAGEGKFLSPLVFSNGKTQEDVVGEVIKAVGEGHKVIFIKGVCGTGKCLDKESLIFCKPSDREYFGNYKISELVGKQGRILSVDKRGSIVETEFKNVRKSGKKSLYRLLTRTGREIVVSKNHPFLTITHQGLEWKSLKDLNKSSYICLPSRINLKTNTTMDENKIKILAHLITEGKLGDKAGSPKYYQDKTLSKEIRKDYENALRNLFPDGIIRNKSQTEVTIIFNNKNTFFGTTNKLRLFIREFGLDGKRSKDKFIPEIIFNLDKKQISLFLKIMFSCDGSIYVRQEKNREKQIIIEYCSISYRLIKDMSLLLNLFGIHHTITSKKFRENKKYSWRITISNKANIKKFIEEIGFIGKKQSFALKLNNQIKPQKYSNIDKVPRIIREYLKNKGHGYNELDRFLNYEEIEKFRQNIGFKQIRKQKLVYSPCVFKQGKIDFLREHLSKVNNYICDENLSLVCNKDIIWDKIKSIKYLKNDETYDLEVPKHYNFIANGMIVHNSAIALNLAKELGRASVVVPVKALQKQYEDDYTNKKYLIKNNGQKLKIKMITGRINFECPFLKEEEGIIKQEIIKQGMNLKLTGFQNLLDKYDENGLEGQEVRRERQREGQERLERLESQNRIDSCDNSQLPCKIEIREKNINQIREYLKKNPRVSFSYLDVIQDVRRMSIAPVCPYWSPIVPSEVDLGVLEDAKIKNYTGLKNTDYSIYQRKKGCGYYDQYQTYVDADIIIFNSQKYKLETVMNRKPATDIEIIDECDEFLDSFSNQKKININRLNLALGGLFADDEKNQKIINELIVLTSGILKDKKVDEYISNESVILLKDTPILPVFQNFLKSDFMNQVECDEENYCHYADEAIRTFEGFIDETYVCFNKEEKDTVVRLVTTNLEKMFREMLDKNKVFVMMSGTIHSNEVLRDIFGLQDFKIIEAETKMPGKIYNSRTGLEINCRYDNFVKGRVTRKQYLIALQKCIEQAEKPALVHVNSFNDLPSMREAKEYNLNIMTREELEQFQAKDSTGSVVQKFKSGQLKILYSTKCNRGVDFPGKTCNSIVLTKYPYPNVKSLFWRILKRTRPQHYSSFYMDKARREFLQRIYRGLRSEQDYICLLSPDIRVFSKSGD